MTVSKRIVPDSDTLVQGLVITDAIVTFSEAVLAGSYMVLQINPYLQRRVDP